MGGDDEVPRADDERRHVNVVHANARLREHRSVEHDGGADQVRDERRREEAPREQVQEEREERPEHDARDAPRERLSPGLDALDRIAPRDDELVVLAVDAEEPIRLAHRYRCERRRAGSE